MHVRISKLVTQYTYVTSSLPYLASRNRQCAIARCKNRTSVTCNDASTSKYFFVLERASAVQMDTVANNAAARTRRGGSLVDASTFYQGTADCISVVNITMHINPCSCSCSAPSIFSSFLWDRLSAIVPSSAAVVASRRLHNFPARTSPPLRIGPSKLVIPLVS